jgi:hypothetical protein
MDRTYHVLTANREEYGERWSKWGERLKTICIAQALLSRISVLVAFCMAFHYTDADSEFPYWILMIISPFAIWNRYTECTLLSVFGGAFRSGKDGMPFMFGLLYSYNDFGDSIVVARMVLADKIIHRKFVQTLLRSHWPTVRHLAPIADTVHLWRIAAMVLVTSQSLHIFIAGAWSSYLHSAMKPFSAHDLENARLTRRGEPGQHGVLGAFAASAEAAGMSALAERMEAMVPDRARRSRMFWMYFTRALFQNAVQVSIETSLLMFLGVQSITDEPMILFNCVLSLTSMFKRFSDMWRMACRECYGRDNLNSCAPVATGLALILIGLAAWNVAKLYFIEVCPHHAWRLSSGCFLMH